jgi:signal transduction histidine kinase/tetratricopeptide (TPR) repeat protein
MKKLSLLLLLLISVFTAAAQKKQIDTLRLALSNAKTDTMRYQALRKLDSTYYLFNPDSSIIFAQQGYLLAKKNNWVLNQSKCLNGMANAYSSLGDYVKSISFYFKALRIGGELNDLFEMSLINDNIGATYIQAQDYRKALPYLRLGLKQSNTFALSHKLLFIHKHLRAIIYLNLGECYLDMHRADSAGYYLNICYDDSKKLNLTNLIGSVQRDMGEVEAGKENKSGALQFFRQAVINDKAIDDGEDMSIAYLSTANLYHKYKQQDSAEYYAQKALETAAAGKYEQDVLNAGKALYTFYDEDNNLPQAYKYFKITTAANDSLYSQDKVKQLLSLDFDEKQRQEDIEAAKTENRNTVRFYVLLAGLAVLLLLVIIFWFANKQRKKAYNLLQRQKQETDLQRTKVEHTLGELKATQTQLVESYNSISVLSQIGKEITSTLNLDTILNTVYEKVNELMEASVFGIGIFISDEDSIDYRMAIEDGRRYTPYRRKMDNKNQLPVWCIENNKEVFINNVQKEYINYISEYAEVNHATLEDGSKFKSPVSLIYLPLTVEEKVIGLITVQSFREDAYTHQHLDILKTLASYTSAALYNANSFETLQATVNELQLTQKQLIQSEKMASLGELTAGIAHEIQNPLNFVNNFSDLNTELIDEMEQELAKGDLAGIKAISLNIKENEKKINMHGKRADSIVKGMLQHSQSGSGKKEPANINTLANEYMRLSYHGLRAKDKSFNAELITHFDPALPKINVVQQDIGRVLLNLFNNAFYAVNQKAKTAGADYKPEVMVTTYAENGQVVIKVKDNGIGIPDSIKEKIMQPFFTTKPTGEGTGLGLSLTYDMVVKGHDGSISVDTREGEFTEFIIKLPSTDGINYKG